MNNTKFFLGKPQDFKKLCLIYPPTVLDATNDSFFLFYKLLTLSQEELGDELVKKSGDSKDLLTPLEFLLNNCFHNKEFELNTKMAFQLFTHEKVSFLYEEKAVIFENEDKTLKSLRALDEQNYFDFQNAIRASIGEKPIEPPRENENPRIRMMRAKARYRDRVKAKQQEKNGLTLTTILASICCMGIGLNPLNIGELSYAAVRILMPMYQGKEKYQLDIDSLLAGADSKKIHPIYWIKNQE